MSDLHDDVFAVSERIRYVALGAGQRVSMRSRPGLADASGADSDRFEELIVNPALITLAQQRGDIDCGGLRHLIVGYGHFDQLVIPLADGHLSVAFELDSNPADHAPAPALLAVLTRHGHVHRTGTNQSPGQ